MQSIFLNKLYHYPLSTWIYRTFHDIMQPKPKRKNKLNTKNYKSAVVIHDPSFKINKTASILQNDRPDWILETNPASSLQVLEPIQWWSERVSIHAAWFKSQLQELINRIITQSHSYNLSGFYIFSLKKKSNDDITTSTSWNGSKD